MPDWNLARAPVRGWGYAPIALRMGATGSPGRTFGRRATERATDDPPSRTFGHRATEPATDDPPSRTFGHRATEPATDDPPSRNYGRSNRFQAVTMTPSAASRPVCQIQRSSRRRAGCVPASASHR